MIDTTGEAKIDTSQAPTRSPAKQMAKLHNS